MAVTTSTLFWYFFPQNLDRVVPGIRIMNKDDQLDVILYGVEDPQQSLSIRDHVENFIVRAKS